MPLPSSNYGALREGPLWTAMSLIAELVSSFKFIDSVN